jgi:hypothetical protein
MIPPTPERKWTATVMVDASRCAANASGYFDLGITRLKETEAANFNAGRPSRGQLQS